MNVFIIFRSSLHALQSHKVRSILTTLGIIIGVVSIIAVMAIGQGAKYKVNQEIQKLGTNFILVLSQSQKRVSQRAGPSVPLLTPRDLNTIKYQVNDIAEISPGRSSLFRCVFEGKVRETLVGGVAESYPNIREWNLTSGEFFTAQDIRSRKRVCVLGKTVLNELFGLQDPIGKTIRIKMMPFTVIGVLDEKGRRADGADQDDIIFVPISTMLGSLVGGGKVRYSAFLISSKSPERLPQAAEDIRSILRQSHKITRDQEEDFTIFTQADIAQASEAASKILNLLLVIIASISLVVGGIGIMNIMLVSVTERTKEIGLRMAVGATTANILNQFIFEAIAICLFGGGIGIMLGVIISKVVGIILGWPMVISLTSIIISLSSSVMIGLFFGYYPAYKASQLNPVDALAER